MDITDRLKTMVADNGLKMTALRQDLLEIFLKTKKPISAYDALDLLKHKRPNAKPPTVYRVIEYFVVTNLFVARSYLTATLPIMEFYSCAKPAAAHRNLLTMLLYLS
jgi:Fe2+ or Zn2+ uptake regulation protein